MRKITKTILLFDLLAGMLFMGFYGMRSRAVVTDSGIVRVAEAGDASGGRREEDCHNL